MLDIIFITIFYKTNGFFRKSMLYQKKIKLELKTFSREDITIQGAIIIKVLRKKEQEQNIKPYIYGPTRKTLQFLAITSI